MGGFQEFLPELSGSFLHRINQTVIDLSFYKVLRKKEEEEYKAEREELRSTWGLLDHEIDEVQKGDYDPWNFEEEDLEEDDYYYDEDE